MTEDELIEWGLRQEGKTRELAEVADRNTENLNKSVVLLRLVVDTIRQCKEAQDNASTKH